MFGGSWGSTLSLAYAQSHPQAVSELVLRGIFLIRGKEIQWFYQYGASEIYPEQWADFLKPIPVEERDDLLGAYHRRLTDGDRDTRLAAARAWSIWEGSTSFLRSDPKRTKQFGSPDFAIALATIEAHYFVNRGFFSCENQLLDGVGAIQVDSGGHRPGPLRCGLSDDYGVGTGVALAGGGPADRGGCGSLGL